MPAVDAGPTVRMRVLEVPEDLGCSAVGAGDRASGPKVLRSDVRSDLPIPDVRLPGSLNGQRMTEGAWAGRPDLKVLFITGYAENAALNHGPLAPGMQLVTKPFGLDILANLGG